MVMTTAIKSNWDILFNTAVGIRYHMARQRHFEKFHRVTTALSLILSSGAFMALSQNTAAAKWLVLFVAILQAFDMVVDTSKMSRLHNDLRQRYIRLEQELVCKRDITISQYQSYHSTLKSIELDEPPLHKVVIEMSQNEAITVFAVQEQQPLKYIDPFDRFIGWFY